MTDDSGAASLPGTTADVARLPVFGLLALATSGFVSILTEALPAGLLPQISRDLGVSEGWAGQFVTVYALASVALAIPLTTTTQGFRRKPLMLSAVAGFAIANSVTALSGIFIVTLTARFFAGIAAGLLWALLPGYAGRMAPPHLRGRAIALAMVGISLALSFGVPAGAFLSRATGWRETFGVLSLLTLGLFIWMALKLPDFPGQAPSGRVSIGQALSIPGVRPVILTTFFYVLAHNILYTYIAPFVVPAGLGDHLDLVLLAFGVAALVGIWITGALIDRWLHGLVLSSILLFGVASLALGIMGREPTVIVTGVAAWGLAFGGAATLFQTALAIAAGKSADVAQSLLVVVWNCAIAGGGLLGAVLLNRAGVGSFPWVLLALLAVAFAVAAWAGQQDLFKGVRCRP